MAEGYIRKCRLFARACTTATIVDVLVDRPGLSSRCKPRRDPPPLAAAYHAPVVYEVCLYSCMWGLGLYDQRPTILWLKSCRDMTRYGNIGMGYTLLLTLQAAALGYSMWRKGSDKREHVMGSVVEVVDALGVDGAKDFYRCLQFVSPSYLWRIGYAGLPEVNGLYSLTLLAEKKVTFSRLLFEASIYDPVSKDIVEAMTYSLGYALDVIASQPTLEEGVFRATYGVASWIGDLILARKAGYIPRELLHKVAQGDKTVLTELEKLLGEDAGPGSAADLVVNAVARLVYEHTV